jgi:hypothetical protein
MHTILYVYFCVRLQPAACLQPVCPVSHSELFSVTDGTWVVVHGHQTSRLARQISSHTHRHQWRRPEVCGTVIRPCTPDKTAYTKHHVGQWQCLYTLRIMCRMPTCCWEFHSPPMKSSFEIMSAKPAWYLLGYKYLHLFEISGSLNSQSFHVD